MPVLNQSLVNATISLQNVLRPANSSPMDFYREPLRLTTQDLVKLCGSFGTNIQVAAIIGLSLTVVAFFWFGKYRPFLLKLFGLDDKLAASGDKLLLMFICIAWAWVIAKLWYGG